MNDSSPAVDVAELEAVLGTELDADVVDVSVLEAGVNRLFSISTADAEDAYVLRYPDKLRAASYMNAIDVEYAVMEHLQNTAVPAPDPVWFCADESVLGEPFFVMTALDGEVVPLGSDLPDRYGHPDARERIATDLVDALATIHATDVEPFRDVLQYVSAREQVERSIDRLDAATATTGRAASTMHELGDWLLANAPADAGAPTSLVHGDYRPGNVLFAGDPMPELSGVLDWETAMIGDPLTELGYLLLRWRDDGDATPALDDIEARYDHEAELEALREDNERGLAPFTNEPGSPTRRELVARYETRTGFAFDDDRFYRAHAAFMLGTVWEDLHRQRVEAGEPSGYEPHAEYVAELGTLVADGDRPL
jgi:aminoglycoside phosphotransferase (APT) family kinase protein